MQIEFICFLNFDSSTCHSRDIQLLVTEILPVLERSHDGSYNHRLPFLLYAGQMHSKISTA